MSSADLNLSTVELTSTLITAPLNGAPSSADYNDSQRANLVDLSTIVSFINNQILPLINALPATALEPTNSPIGIQGNTIWSNTGDLSALFFNSLSSTPLTIYDSLILLNGIITTNSQQLIDLGVEVAALQSILSSTNQNDISLALQNIASSLNQTIVTQNSQGVAIASLQQLLNNEIAIATTHLTTPMTANAVVIGNGGGDLKVVGSLGTTTTVLHGNIAGPPSFGPVVEADLFLSNVTTNNASISNHGLLPILPGDPTLYLDGTGNFTTPAGGGGGGGGRGTFAETIGNGSSTTFTVTHGLDTTDLVVDVYNLSTGEIEIVDAAIINANSISVTFSVAPALNSERVVIFGTGGETGSGSGGSFAATIGNGSSSVYTITHNLGTTDIVVGVHNLSTGDMDIVDVDILDINNVSITFGTAPALNSERAVVLSVGAGGGGGGSGSVSFPPVAHEFLNSYDSSSGLFTAAVPSISDLGDSTGTTNISLSTFGLNFTGSGIVQVPRLNSINGFRSNGSAPLGAVLVGNGSDFVSSQLEAVLTFSTSNSISITNSANVLVKAIAGAGGITLTLPTAAGLSGNIIRVIQIDTGVGGVIISTVGGQTINGSSSYILTNQWQTISMESDNANWIIICTAN